MPKEWNIRDAYVKDSRGERVVDFRAHNLHVLSYSAPVERQLSLAELRPHLLHRPGAPDWIPYRTCYYQETGASACRTRSSQALPDGDYEVMIDATLAAAP